VGQGSDGGPGPAGRRGGIGAPLTDGPAGEDRDPAALLERFRRSGIRIDRQGQFWHEGATVQHQGLRRALFRWLDRLPPPDGRYVLRLDAQRFAYLEVEDTPLVATSLRWVGDQALLGLSDGSEEPLDPATVTLDQAGVLRCRARGGRLEARLGTAAASALAERIEAPGERPVLVLGGRRHPLGARR
jgi:hypothetical protein